MSRIYPRTRVRRAIEQIHAIYADDNVGLRGRLECIENVYCEAERLMRSLAMKIEESESEDRSRWIEPSEILKELREIRGTER